MSRAMVGEGNSRRPLRTYAWLIIIITVFTVVAAITIMALRPSTYTSSSMVVVAAKSTTGIHVLPDMDVEQHVAFSGEVASRAAHRLGLPPAIASGGLWVSVPNDTSILNISYSAGSPREASAGAEAFTKAYVTYRNERTAGLDLTVITPPTQPSALNFPLVIGLSLVLGTIIGVLCLAWHVGRSRIRRGEPSHG
jgi:capsular polysaccharide biosynthesis protein